MAAKETVGVIAMVEGLLSFMESMKKMDKSIKGVGDSGTLMSRVFSGLGSVISGLVSGAFRILEVALGVLLRDAIRAVIDQFRELISSAIEVTTEFQKLEVRLNRMNFNDLTQAQINLGLGMEFATQQTQEQLKWIIQLGASTPFDSSDIGNVYTLARSYGFANQEAQDLTTEITNFASGMGLSNEVIERIIQNFGQMKQAGKITGTEIKDLARGAFVPVNDILDRVAENLGITQEQLASLRKKGLTDAEMFFTAFGGMVDDDFQGAAQDMNKVLAVSIENIKEMARSFLAFNVIKPIFEGLARVVSEFQQALSSRFDQFWAISQRIGITIGEIIDEITTGLPSVHSLASGIAGALDGVSTWLIEHKNDIVAFVQGALAELGKLAAWAFGTSDVGDKGERREGPGFGEIITPGQDGAIAGLVDSLTKLSDWVTENKPLITDFFKALGEIVSGVVRAFTPEGMGGGGGEGFLSSVTTFMQFVVDNKEEITKWATVLLYAFVVWQLITTALQVVVPIVIFLAGVLLFLVQTWGLVTGVLSLVWEAFLLVVAVLGLITAPVWALIAAIVILAVIFMKNKERLLEIVTQLWAIIVHYFNLIKDSVTNTVMQLLFIASYYFELIKTRIKTVLTKLITEFVTWKTNVVQKFRDTVNEAAALPWFRIGAAIISGVVTYVQNRIGVLTDIISGAVQNALDGINDIFGDSGGGTGGGTGFIDRMSSGIKEGLISGVEAAAPTVAAVVQDAVMAGMAPALSAPAMAMSRSMPSSVNTTYQNQTNLTANFHSNTKSESLIQDFAMLRSLVGA